MKHIIHILTLFLLCVLHHCDGQENNPIDVFFAFDTTIYVDPMLAADLINRVAYKDLSKSQKAELNKRQAILARIEGRYTDALTDNLAALGIYTDLKDSFHIAEVYHNMGYLMRQTNDYPKSIEYFNQAISYRELLGDSSSRGQSHKEIGVIYRKMGNLDKAEFHYNTAMNLFNPERDKRDILTLRGNFATLYSAQGNLQKAVEMNILMLPEVKASKELESLGTRYNNIAYIYFKLKEYDKATSYIDSAIVTDRTGNFLAGHVRHTKLKSRILYKAKLYKAAYKERRLHAQLQDSLFSLSLAESLDSKVTLFKKEKRLLQDSLETESQKLLLSNQIEMEHSRRMKTLWLSLFIGIVLLSLMMWQLYRLKLTKLKAKNEKLTSQMLEHKLQNTEQENERLVQHASLQVNFKESILHKVDAILSRNTNSDRQIRDLQRELSDQLRLDSQEEVLNQSIQDMPRAFDEFLARQYPSLTTGERELCFLVRNGLSIKEISDLRQTSSSAIQSMRYRVRKKLGLQKGQELKSYLRNLTWR